MPKILIIDDSKFSRDQMSEILNRAGFSKLIYAKDGEEAVIKCRKEKPDLALLDLIMPKKHGLDVLKELKGCTKVIVVTAIGNEKIYEKAKSIGIEGYVVKPINSDDEIVPLVCRSLQECKVKTPKFCPLYRNIKKNKKRK